MMEITPATVDFGNVQVGNSATRVITVFNGGTDSLDIESILADGSIAHAMSIKDQGFIIPPDNRRDILIQFTPPSGGNIDGQIIVAGFDTSASIRVLAKVTDLTLLKSDFLLPESFAFGYTEPGATARGVITLSNTTGEPLRIDSIRIAGNADQPFSIEGIVMPQRLEKKIVDGEANPILSLSQWNLAANDTLGISLAYLPTGQPGDSGSLLIFAASGLRTVALSGSGSNEDENATLDPVARGTHPDKDLPEAFSMEQNFPNPFNPATTIRYSIPIGGSVLLRVYNVLGQKVATLVEQDQEAGYHSVVWNAYQMSGGIYFYQLRSGGFTITKQLVLLK